jgi:hypothetical protein
VGWLLLPYDALRGRAPYPTGIQKKFPALAAILLASAVVARQYRTQRLELITL